ncbi:MAG TPA: hypothetical protein VHU77_05660 [Candidatus Limnocylindria bacterium]|jgi:hypothetical protein|nr:hypothetical protein [Candidatus Limnocylindria bacterium]
MTELLHQIIPTRPPMAALIGVGIALLGLGLDIVVHLTSGEAHHEEIGFSWQENGAHLVGLIGMVVALAGVVIDGISHGKES